MTERPAWSRRRLQTTAAAVLVVAGVLLAGLAYLLWESATSPSKPESRLPNRAQPVVLEPRDAIAAQPMRAVPASAARGGAPATEPAPTVTIPPASGTGPAGVPTGFDHTPTGAIGQLAAIETTSLTGMSMDTVRAVHAGWVLPGGATVDEWALTEGVHAFTTAASGQPAATPLAVWATPVGAQVKGSAGPDWVLACVLLRVDAVLARPAAVAYGHCERMAWTGRRWQIAPGAPPAPAPSTWPGTGEAAAAGWLTWAETEPS